MNTDEITVAEVLAVTSALEAASKMQSEILIVPDAVVEQLTPEERELLGPPVSVHQL